MPAPSYLNKTAAENEISRLVVKGLPDKEKTQSQYDRSQLRSQLTSKLRQHDPDVNAKIAEAFQNHKLTREDVQMIRRDVRKPPILVGFNRLSSYAERQHVYDMATPEEQQILAPALRRAEMREKRNGELNQ